MQIFRVLPDVVRETRRSKCRIPEASHHRYEPKLPLRHDPVPLDNIKAAIDERYGKWAVPEFLNSPLKLWRVEPEKFAIQLSVATKKVKNGI